MKKKKKHIVKHTTKKFKMSDFCFLFLSVGNGVKMKTFSYDSNVEWRVSSRPIKLDCDYLRRLLSMWIHACRANFPALSHSMKVSFVVVMELSRRAPLHGGAFQWRFTHNKTPTFHRNVLKKKYFKILIIILCCYVYFGEIRRRKKKLSTKLLCELEIMYEGKHHQAICQSFEADRSCVWVLRCRQCDATFFFFFPLRHKKRFQLKCFILIASRFSE